MIEAEQSIIGCILINDECMKDIDFLEPKMFESDFYGDVYREILGIYESGDKITILNITQNIISDKYDKDYVLNELKGCMMASDVSNSAKTHAKIINRQYKSRELKRVLKMAKTDPSDIDENMANIISEIEALMTDDVVNVKSIKQIVNENKDNYFTDVEKEGIKLGLEKLDDIVGQLIKGDILVLGARPSVGKSALSLQIIDNQLKIGKKVAYFNLEMADSQIYERFVCHESKISLTRMIRAKNFLGDEKNIFERTNSTLEKYKLDVSNYRKVSQIKNFLKHRDYDLVVIDYLQLMESGRRYNSRSAEVGDISKSIKAMAMELNIPIILLSQLNRESEYHGDKEPSMKELRESGDIEQDASIIILMWSLSEKNDKFKGIKVAKNRQGTKNREGLYFDGENMKYKEINDSLDTVIENLKVADRENSDIDKNLFVMTDNIFGE